MAGNIQNVNLTKLKAEIEAYEEKSGSLFSAVRGIGTALRDSRTYWSGKRMNNIITLWNNNCQSMDEQVRYFCQKISGILKAIYYQYESLEKGKGIDYTVGIYVPNEIVKIDLTDENTIKFNESYAKTIINDVISVNNTRASAALKELINKLDSVKNYSDSLKSLQAAYTSNATNLQSTLNKLCTQIQTEAEQAYNDTKATESYNEKDAAKAKTVN